MDVQQTSNVSQILQWLNGLTLPSLLVGAFTVARWLTKKEDEVKAGIAEAKAELATLRTNDLHHIQGTLDEIKTGQEKVAQAAERHKSEIVAAITASQTAIVQAIMTTRK